MEFNDMRNERLILRKAIGADLDGIVALKTDPAIRRFLGGAAPVARVRAKLLVDGLESVTADPGTFVVASARTNEMLGMVTLDRRPPQRPGHVRPEGNELELSYLLLPAHWGHGFAYEACELLLKSAEAAWPGEVVLVVTQTANAAAVALATRLGFEHVDSFEEFGAPQWLGVRTL